MGFQNCASDPCMFMKTDENLV